MSTPSELMQLVDDAWNAQDWATFARYHADDVVVRLPGQPPSHGVEHHEADARRVFATFPDNQVSNRPYRVLLAEGDWTCSIARFSGTMTEPMRLPDGTVLPPTGKSFEVDFCTVARWADGRIVEENLFYDRDAMMRQLGLTT
ncbi:ester cyclase [Nonomuraea sp. NPDC050310]|uniref:ester cyclase n=1 Tax=Nonomuraea sp. NPDC050310 TaxID=3154935 RepID=UPI0033BFEA79